MTTQAEATGAATAGKSLDQWWCPAPCGTANRSFRRECRACGRPESADATRSAFGCVPAEFLGSNLIDIATNGTVRRVPSDEPVFLIRGQDIVGGAAVRAWAKLAEAAGAATDIIRSAREHAEKMDAWPRKKTPDLRAALRSAEGARDDAR